MWTLEHIKQRFNLNDHHLPQVYIIALREPYRKTNITELFKTLRHVLSTGHASAASDCEVRNLCAMFFAWGGDFLPNIHFITAKTFCDAYVKMRPLIGTPLIESVGDLYPTFRYGCVMNGSALRILTVLAFGMKWIWKLKGGKTKENLDKRARDIRKAVITYRSTPLEALERVAIADGKSRSIPNRLPSSATIQARMDVVAVSIYCVDHALKAVPGFDTNVADIDLPSGAFMDTFADKMTGFTSEERYVCSALGWMRPGAFIEWTETVFPRKATTLRSKTGKTMEQLAVNWIFWPGRSPPSSSSSSSSGASSSAWGTP